MAMVVLYGVLGCWAAMLRVEARFVPWVVAAISGGTVLLVVHRYLGWFFGRFVITNKRLMSTEGLVVRRVAMIPLLRVTDLRYVQSPLGRMLNYGTFRLESAGRANRLRTIVDLPRPDEMYLRLVEEMYEPAAVEARLHGDGDENHTQSRDPEEIRRDVLDRIGVLAAQPGALAEAIQRLDQRPASGPYPQSALTPEAAREASSPPTSRLGSSADPSVG